MVNKKPTREEKAVERFIPEMAPKTTTEKITKEEPEREEILRHTTEKRVLNEDVASKMKTVEKRTQSRGADVETVEQVGDVKKRVSRKKSAGKGAKKKISKRKTTVKETKYSVPKILLKKDGYELVITEKPQAAMKIAEALGVSTKREIVKSVAYYEVDRKGKKIIVACAVGHLFTLKQNKAGSRIPEFDISWVPNYLVRKGDFTKKYYDTLLKLAKNAGSITVATDFDIEGEVIGTNVVKLICNQADANRMKFSTLTTKELDFAYENKTSHINWGQATAGEARHFLDWYYGINLSRALMNAIKTTGKFKIMSIGRVQGPTLKLIVDKEREIKKFVPEPFWQEFITIDEPKIELKYIKDIFDKSKLKEFEGLVGRDAEVETKKTEQKIEPGTPFNLTDLQTEAYKLHGITPSNTLKAAQSLYLASLISYPRTSSQKLPDSIDYKSILDTLKIRFKVAKLITKDKPLEGKKTDPAHPSIYPTGNKAPVLSGDEEKIYNLIVYRFLALFCDPAILDKKRVVAIIDDKKFSANGTQIRFASWMEFYPKKTKEVELADAVGTKKIISQREEEKETQPPKRYSQASILSELEKRNLGTKATRAAILETLYDRGYIVEKSIEATPLGVSLINTLEKYSPVIIDEKLTSSLQNEMDKIVELDGISAEEFHGQEDKILDTAKESIKEIIQEFGKKENLIGSELVDAQEKQREIEREQNKLNTCPKCNKANLKIIYSPKNRKFFIACDGYPSCKNTYSLPPYGMIKQVGKNCESCDFPLLMALQKGKKPWIFCFNYDCPTNRERVEAYRAKMAQEQN